MAMSQLEHSIASSSLALSSTTISTSTVTTTSATTSNSTITLINPASSSSALSSTTTSTPTVTTTSTTTSNSGITLTNTAPSSLTLSSTISSTTTVTTTPATTSSSTITLINPAPSTLALSSTTTSTPTVTTTSATTSNSDITITNTTSSSTTTGATTNSTPSTNSSSTAPSAASNANTNVNPAITGTGNKLYLINTPKFDSIKIIEWKDGIGTLPGSKLKFKVNEYGTLEMLYDDEHIKVADKPVPKPIESVKAPTESSNGTSTSTNNTNSTNNNNTTNNTNNTNNDTECVNCGIKGVKSNFIRNGRFCSQSCATMQSTALKIFSKLSTISGNNNSGNNSNDNNTSNSNSNVAKPDFVKKKILYKGGRMYVDILSDKVRVRQPFLMRTDRSDIVLSARSETPDGLDLLDANEEIENIDSFTGINVPHKKFNWKEYLEETKTFCAPVRCFKENQTFPSVKNGFKVGMKLEGIDPHNPALYCVLTVAEVVGFRLRLHFDGYPDIYDFWVNADSPFIFPVGWCQKTGRKLESPKEFFGSFNWANYLQVHKSQAAPNYLFSCVKSSYTLSQFRVGMKLEAVDKANTSLVCVATVADILDNYILVHFDGWDDSYDYWISMTSPYIHPYDWCLERGKPLTPPKDYPLKSNEKFKWADYLKETKATAVPAKAFRLRSSNSFRAGMKCEVVDKRYPRLIRVATIVDRRHHTVKIHFDGWDEKYDFWLDDDSPDIHPVNWCAKTNHPLQPPPSYFRKNTEIPNCPTPGCSGFGSIKSARFTLHNTSANCPYSDENMERELPDRFGRDFSDDEIHPKSPPGEENSCPPSPTSFSDMRRKRKRKRENSGSSASDSVKLSRPSTPSSSLFQHNKHNYSATISTLHQAIYSLRMNQNQSNEAPLAWEKHSKNLLSFADKVNASEVLQWGPDKVAQFVSTIPGCQDFGRCFEDEMIDGEAFLLLNQTDLVTHLGIKLGPAVKIYNSILVIRDNIEA
ncbi:lethal(3)malignant brain tumor-like protein 4 isoform X2 [Tetranychus urticae]|uniref:lethal(3)malignant brain tumor-like protein 4 isoform X2 n=1 Tax=Tetranychus urticae TaxID=32264 RepID=UPI00077BF8C6|nr:lethal(3)malignant brain tumor-like protein 4 isoform X2 [Tetranychus urticae]